MLASIFSLNVLQTALELGCIYGLVALALFLSYSILNIADLSTDGCFTLGCAVACQVALTGHPILALAAAMAAGVCSGFVTAFLQTRLGVESIMAGIIVNTGLYHQSGSDGLFFHHVAGQDPYHLLHGKNFAGLSGQLVQAGTGGRHHCCSLRGDAGLSGHAAGSFHPCYRR